MDRMQEESLRRGGPRAGGGRPPDRGAGVLPMRQNYFMRRSKSIEVPSIPTRRVLKQPARQLKLPCGNTSVRGRKSETLSSVPSPGGGMTGSPDKRLEGKRWGQNDCRSPPPWISLKNQLMVSLAVMKSNEASGQGVRVIRRNPRRSGGKNLCTGAAHRCRG